MDWENFRLSERLALSASTTEKIYTAIAEIDAVKTSWRLTNTLMPQAIQRLTHSVIVTSTGASNRIEGNRLTDDQVEELYRNLRIKKFRTRDEQEVAGYLNALQTVFGNYSDIPVTESSILQLHRDMLVYSDKDEGHRGKYKFGSNRVEAKDRKGNLVGVIFDPTPPHLVPKEMSELCSWYQWATETRFKHPLILLANLIFEYLAIHPFQDGNGRASRLLTNLLLLQNDYHFATVVSYERLIEERKADYYLSLNQAQSSWKTGQEDVSQWLIFILEVFRQQAVKALALLEEDDGESLLSEKQLALWRWISQLPDGLFNRRMAIAALDFPPRTIEASIKRLLEMKRIERIGQGRATRYRVIGKLSAQ